jgi:hypothetical protein
MSYRALTVWAVICLVIMIAGIIEVAWKAGVL